MTDRLKQAILQRCPLQDSNKVTVAARIAVEFSMSMLDMANRTPSQADEIIENNIRLGIFQLAPFFTNDPQPND